MAKFEVGDSLFSTCWFSGGMHTYEVVERSDTEVSLSAIYEEMDGVHRIEPTSFPIRVNEKGDEYVVLYEYHGEENRLYAS